MGGPLLSACIIDVYIVLELPVSGKRKSRQRKDRVWSEGMCILVGVNTLAIMLPEVATAAGENYGMVETSCDLRHDRGKRRRYAD